jgi:hypothetical protein
MGRWWLLAEDQEVGHDLSQPLGGVKMANEEIREQILFVLEDDNEGMRAALDSDLDEENKQMNRDLIVAHERIIEKVERGEDLAADDLVLIRDANEIHLNDTGNLGCRHQEAVVLDEWLDDRVARGNLGAPAKVERGDRTDGHPYPVAADPARVGMYPGLAGSGGGYFYDDVLEYRVWVHPDGGGDDGYRAFATFEQASAFSQKTDGAEPPLVLVLQREWIDEPKTGEFIQKKGERITEWQVEWLKEGKRNSDSISKFMAERTVKARRRASIRSTG